MIISAHFFFAALFLRERYYWPSHPKDTAEMISLIKCTDVEAFALSQVMHLNTGVSMTVTILDFFNVGIYSNKHHCAFLHLK